MSAADSFQKAGNPVQALQADRVRALGESLKSGSSNARIAKAAKDFEAILLSQWVQDAERCFASVPGEDSEESGLPGKDAYQGMGAQAIGGALAASGGIGIAKMITRYFTHNNNDTSNPGANAPDRAVPQERQEDK